MTDITSISLRSETCLERLLEAYAPYYTINRETPATPFIAEAVFSVHGENYFLMKVAKYAEMDSKEYVFFAVCDRLDDIKLTRLDERAWSLGLERTQPGPNHRNTDVILFIIANEVTEDAARMIKKARHYKSYRFGIRGWNAYKLAVCESSSGKVWTNPLGRELRKHFQND